MQPDLVYRHTLCLLLLRVSRSVECRLPSHLKFNAAQHEIQLQEYARVPSTADAQELRMFNAHPD